MVLTVQDTRGCHVSPPGATVGEHISGSVNPLHSIWGGDNGTNLRGEILI
jgi:hypothetical protein